ncbi:hypothetical protein SCHPADRAFT_40683 [Schizopora paradoxa]|uniref:Uncharacterized protein n=1 Tax=Schizopora paradoxa TaxID=27342 RepID=A0A0H2SRR0_9AGAM|nr:hypothetical protein SCHPADRAFT_40683 [Schizopora paradoxa]
MKSIFSNLNDRRKNQKAKEEYNKRADHGGEEVEDFSAEANGSDENSEARKTPRTEIRASDADVDRADDLPLPEAFATETAAKEFGVKGPQVDSTSWGTSSKLTSTDSLSNFLTTKMTSNPLCYQGKRFIYNVIYFEALYAACRTYLERVENVLVCYWKNDTDTNQKLKLECTVQCTPQPGSSEILAKSINLLGIFEGLTVGTGADAKTFGIVESTGSTKCTMSAIVSPRSKIWLYQRRYVFRTNMTFVLDSWNTLSNVGSPGGYHIQEETCFCHIDTQDFVITGAELTGEQMVDWPSESVADLMEDNGRRVEQTKMWEKLTTRCRNALTESGVHGCQVDVD